MQRGSYWGWRDASAPEMLGEPDDAPEDEARNPGEEAPGCACDRAALEEAMLSSHQHDTDAARASTTPVQSETSDDTGV